VCYVPLWAGGKVCLVKLSFHDETHPTLRRQIRARARSMRYFASCSAVINAHGVALKDPKSCTIFVRF
jgi:hypothetical protein